MFLLRKFMGNKLIEHPVNYGDAVDLDQFEPKDEVYIVDFSFPPDVLKSISERVHKIYWMDHHETAAKYVVDVPDNVEVHFDQNFSGAKLVSNFLEENFPDYCEPWFVNYIEDRDLWKWQMPNSREVNAYIATANFDYDEWLYMAEFTPMQYVLGCGKSLLRKLELDVDRISRDAVISDRITFVNTPIFQSDVGNKCVQRDDCDVALMWYLKDDKIRFSVRSSLPVANIIAESFGGGGHPKAAGFEYTDLDKPILSILDECRTACKSILAEKSKV